jgi:hypothetical protein
MSRIPFLKIIAGVVLGAVAGYGYHYYNSCSDGTCMISSSPYISTLYGSVMGVLFLTGLWGDNKRKNNNNENK